MSNTWETRSRAPTALLRMSNSVCKVLNVKASHVNIDGVVGNMVVKSQWSKYDLNIFVVPFLWDLIFEKN